MIKELRGRGCRITRQRELLIDIILKEESINCKKIYYKALKEDPNIGIATVYRMVQTLEEIGAIKRENTRLTKLEEYTEVKECVLKLKGDEILRFDQGQLKQLIQSGMEVLGYGKDMPVEEFFVKCETNPGGEI